MEHKSRVQDHKQKKREKPRSRKQKRALWSTHKNTSLHVWPILPIFLSKFSQIAAFIYIPTLPCVKSVPSSWTPPLDLCSGPTYFSISSPQPSSPLSQISKISCSSALSSLSPKPNGSSQCLRHCFSYLVFGARWRQNPWRLHGRAVAERPCDVLRRQRCLWNHGCVSFISFPANHQTHCAFPFLKNRVTFAFLHFVYIFLYCGSWCWVWVINAVFWTVLFC